MDAYTAIGGKGWEQSAVLMAKFSPSIPPGIDPLIPVQVTRPDSLGGASFFLGSLWLVSFFSQMCQRISSSAGFFAEAGSLRSLSMVRETASSPLLCKRFLQTWSLASCSVQQIAAQKEPTHP